MPALQCCKMRSDGESTPQCAADEFIKSSNAIYSLLPKSSPARLLMFGDIGLFFLKWKLSLVYSIRNKLNE